jgi:hypothetical protein
VNVVRKDERGAEFAADRKTKTGKKVRAFATSATETSSSKGRTRGATRPDRRGRSIRSTTATARSTSTRRRAWVPAWDRDETALKRLFYRINFTPFITEAERRAEGVAGE